MIRDLGLALSMGQTPLSIMSARWASQDPKWTGAILTSGQDLHIGDWSHGILPPTAPLPIASATATGIALASSRKGDRRFILAPVGEGCSSSGEFWEAINFAGARGVAYMLHNPKQSNCAGYILKQTVWCGDIRGQRGLRGTSGMEHRWV